MTRHDNMPLNPVREQSADMEDDMTSLHITPYHMSYLPMSSSEHSTLCPDSDRCDTTDACVSIEKVGPCHQQVPSLAGVADHPTSSLASGS